MPSIRVKMRAALRHDIGGNRICLSMRPGRMRALSRDSGLLVVMTRMRPSFATVPSITLRRVLSVITDLASKNETCSKDPGLRDFPGFAGLGAKGRDIPGGGGTESLFACSIFVVLTGP